MTHSIRTVAVIFYGQSRTYIECAENLKTFFSTNNPNIHIDFFCSINAETSYIGDPVYKKLGSNEVDIQTVSDNIRKLYSPVHMSTFSTYNANLGRCFAVYVSMLNAISEKKKYEIKQNKFYDLTVICRYDLKFEANGILNLDQIFDFVITTINHHYSVEKSPTYNNDYNLPVCNPNIFVMDFNNSTVPSNWFRPQDIFINGIDDYAFIGTGVAIDMLFSIIANMCYVPVQNTEHLLNSDNFKPDFYSTYLQCTHHDMARMLAKEKINMLSLKDFLRDNGTYFNYKRVRPKLSDSNKF